MFSLRRLVALVSPILCWRLTLSMEVNDPLRHSTVLDPDGKYHLAWDFDDEKIVFEVRVQTLGYVGFGLSPNGGMTGADVVIGGVSDPGARPYFEDRFAIGMSEPLVDLNANWYLHTAAQTDTHTVLRFWRKLNTCDKDDLPITEDTARVIWAYHDNDWGSTTDGSVRYHGNLRGTKSILLLNPQKILPQLPNDVTTIDFINNNVKVPGNDTTYWCEGFSMHVFQEPHHVIKVEPIIQPGNEQLVHHIVLYACPLNTANQTAGQGGPCRADFMPPAWRGCIMSIFAWAVGGGPIYFPEHVGYPFGNDDDPKLIILETHFDNPGKRTDFVDSSGLRLTLTRQLRRYDAGAVSVGSLVWKTLLIPPYEKSFRSEGHCVPDCLAQGMGDVSEINVFATFPHAHLLGKSVRLRHFRDGRELKPIVADHHYDFNYQETRVLVDEVKVRKGDHLSTECIYDSRHKTSVTFGGESTNEEMCLTFVMYYPKTALSNCHSLVSPQLMGKFANVTFYDNFTVSTPESKHGRRVDDIMVNDIDWTDEGKRYQFQRLLDSPDYPVISFCHGAAPFPAYGSQFKFDVSDVYREPDVCLIVSGTVTSSAVAGIVFALTALALLF